MYMRPHNSSECTYVTNMCIASVSADAQAGVQIEDEYMAEMARRLKVPVVLCVNKCENPKTALTQAQVRAKKLLLHFKTLHLHPCCGCLLAFDMLVFHPFGLVHRVSTERLQCRRSGGLALDSQSLAALSLALASPRC